jgi:high-affinity Fe2+/Pb2+ permease
MAVAWVLLRTSRRLPVGTFFAASSLLIAALALVLTGKGMQALREPGWLATTHRLRFLESIGSLCFPRNNPWVRKH